MTSSLNTKVCHAIILTAVLSVPAMAQNLTQFVNGEVANAETVNANFNALKTTANAAQAVADAAQASTTGLTNALTVSASQVAINRRLTFPSTVANRKVVLFQSGNNNDHQFFGFGSNQGTLRYQTDSVGSSHVFFSANTASSSNELMRIGGNGNIGIGTSSPTTPLHVATTGSGATLTLQGNPLVKIQFQNLGPAINWDLVHDNTGWAVSRSGVDYPFGILENGSVAIGTNRFVTNGFKLEVGGNIRCTNVTQTSSRELKQGITPLTGALDSIMKLRSVSYAWNDLAPEGVRGQRDIGFIADEVDAVLPEIVAKDETGKPIGIAYGKVTSVAVGAIQELKIANDALTTENDELRQRLEALEAAVAQLQPLMAKK